MLGFQLVWSFSKKRKRISHISWPFLLNIHSDGQFNSWKNDTAVWQLHCIAATKYLKNSNRRVYFGSKLKRVEPITMCGEGLVELVLAETHAWETQDLGRPGNRSRKCWRSAGSHWDPSPWNDAIHILDDLFLLS